MGPQTATPAHVLVVAPEEVVRTNLAALIRQVGYRSATAPNLSRARELIADSWVNYEVVVVDVSGDSAMAFEQIEDLADRYDVGLVLVTAPDDIRLMTRAEDNGAIGFMTIPVSAARVLRGIAGVHRQIQARRRNAWYTAVVESHRRQASRGTVIDITDAATGRTTPER